MPRKVKPKRDPKDFTVHMIGNAHIDPVWLWRWQEGYDEMVSTSRSALDRMNEYPDFIFCRSSAAMHLAVEEDDPELFAEIARRAQEGRWHIVNGWWEQPDCNLPGGESFIRQGLYGKRYFQERLGVEVTAGYNVDTFGHCATLPQILTKCGFTSYTFFRPGPHEKQLPGGVFWWEGPDGTRILACRPPFMYASRDDIEERILKCFEQTQEPLHHVMCFYGVGNHGGGPTIANIEGIHRVNARADAPNVICSTPDAFFAAVLAETADLPVVGDELQHHAVGCYSATGEVKRRNRRREMLLLSAEKFAAIASRACGVPYLTRDLTQAWQRVLFNQFHDVLAGTSILEAYQGDVYPWYDEADRLAGAALDKCLRAIASRINTGESAALVAFNPLSWRRREALTALVPVERDSRGKFQVRMLDHEGHEIPIQVGPVHLRGRRYFAEVTFIADVPSLGYRTYRFESQPAAPITSPVSAADTVIENEHYRLTIDIGTGGIKELYDKTSKVVAMTGGARPLVVLDDHSDTWSHGVEAYRNEVGRFWCGGRIEVVERGPLRATLRITSTWGASTVVQEISLTQGSRRIDWKLRIDWHERLKALKLAVPVNVRDGEATFEVPYGTIVREAGGNEEPLQHWMDVTGAPDGRSQQYGVSLLNDCKYGGDATDNEMRLTLLRSPIYAFHDPRAIEPDVTYDWTDQGRQVVRCALVPHGGGWQEAGTVREGWALNVPLGARLEPAHSGNLPPTQSFIAAEPENVVLSVAKQAEEGQDLIVRLYETDGRDGEVKVSLPAEGASWAFPLGHFEIKTIRISRRDGKLTADEVDMLERDIAQGR